MMLEMIKQQVAINKLVRRNYEMEQRQIQESYGKYQVNQLNSNSKSFRGAPTMNDELS